MPDAGKSSGGSRLIVTTALAVGAVAFTLGYVGPLLVSSSNLGPLLGIFVTGPLGFLAGALAGILLSARDSAGRAVTVELKWLLGAWGLALFFTLASSVAGISLSAITAQLAVIGCAAVLFYGLRAELPAWLGKWRAVVLIGAALALLTSIYPPLIKSPDGARFAFFLDPRFDASTQIPDYSVNQGALLVSWLVIAGILATMIVVAQRWRALK